MKVINTFIVSYEKSFADNELAILFELVDGTYVLKYAGLEYEEMNVISKEIAVALIK